MNRAKLETIVELMRELRHVEHELEFWRPGYVMVRELVVTDTTTTSWTYGCSDIPGELQEYILEHYRADIQHKKDAVVKKLEELEGSPALVNKLK